MLIPLGNSKVVTPLCYSLKHMHVHTQAQRCKVTRNITCAISQAMDKALKRYELLHNTGPTIN